MVKHMYEIDVRTCTVAPGAPVPPQPLMEEFKYVSEEFSHLAMELLAEVEQYWSKCVACGVRLCSVWRMATSLTTRSCHTCASSQDASSQALCTGTRCYGRRGACIHKSERCPLGDIIIAFGNCVQE